MVECLCPAWLLSVKAPVRKCWAKQGIDKLTNFDHTKATKVEIPIIAATTHNQLEPQIVRRRAAVALLMSTGLVIERR